MRSVPMLRCHNPLRARRRLWHRGIGCRYACSYCKCCTRTHASESAVQRAALHVS